MRRGLPWKKVLLATGCALVCLIGCGTEKAADGGDPATAKPAAEALPDGLTPEQAAKVVARVGERTITVGDVTRQINRLSPYIRRRWAAPEKRKEFLEKLIRVELLSQEAERLGLDDDPEVQRTVKQVMIRLMIKNDLEKNLLPTAIEEPLLKEAYEKDHDKYHRPAQIRASHIVVKTVAEAKTLIAELQADAKDTRRFRDKAREVSVDEESKSRGGDLGYFSRPAERRDDEPEVAAAVAEAAWKLEKVGDFVPEPVETGKGFHVVKLTNKKPEMNRSFDSVKRLIENRLLREKRKQVMDQFVEKLRTDAKIELFPENLAKLEISAEGEGHQHSHGSPIPSDIPGAKMPPRGAKPAPPAAGGDGS